MMGATAGALASSSLAALHAQHGSRRSRRIAAGRIAAARPPAATAAPRAAVARPAAPAATPPAHGRALWRPSSSASAPASAACCWPRSCSAWPSSCSGARRLPPPLPRRPPTCRTSSPDPRRHRDVSARRRRARSVALGDGAAPPPTEKWSPRALLAVGAALRMERRGRRPAWAPRLESAGSSSCLRHNAGADGGGGARGATRCPKSPRRHAPPDAHPVARPQVSHPRRKGSSASISSTASTPARPRRAGLPPLSAAEAPKACRRCASCSTPSGRTCRCHAAILPRRDAPADRRGGRAEGLRQRADDPRRQRAAARRSPTIGAPPGYLGERMAEVAQIFLTMTPFLVNYASYVT